MTGCGFVSTPVITAVSRGPRGPCPGVSLRYVWYKGFDVVTVVDAAADDMVENDCDIYWTAHGFVC